LAERRARTSLAGVTHPLAPARLPGWQDKKLVSRTRWMPFAD